MYTPRPGLRPLCADDGGPPVRVRTGGPLFQCLSRVPPQAQPWGSCPGSAARHETCSAAKSCCSRPWSSSIIRRTCACISALPAASSRILAATHSWSRLRRFSCIARDQEPCSESRALPSSSRQRCCSSLRALRELWASQSAASCAAVRAASTSPASASSCSRSPSVSLRRPAASDASAEASCALWCARVASLQAAEWRSLWPSWSSTTAISRRSCSSSARMARSSRSCSWIWSASDPAAASARPAASCSHRRSSVHSRSLSSRSFAKERNCGLAWNSCSAPASSQRGTYASSQVSPPPAPASASGTPPSPSSE
mmetsp:Transcript_11435/g.33908  ORF Transcript_11435/g.33908 Transcript_11435/m.33908 type:complete len:314 (+) Transcript_11435:1-942(+)